MGTGVAVTTVSPPERASTDERIAAIHERMTQLRRQADVLVTRAREATDQALGHKDRPRAQCNHAQQVQQMRAALDAVEHELDGLRTAMQTRAAIEQAKGMIMFHRKCDADEAFRLLVELSQNAHRKLFEIAQTLVASWSAPDDGPA